MTGLERRFRNIEAIGAVAVAAVAVVVAVLIASHTSGVNGPKWWQWEWRRLPTLRVWPWMLAAALPFLVGQAWFGRRPGRPLRPLLLVAGSTVLLALAAVVVGSAHNDLGPIAARVEDPYVNSYHSAALRVKDTPGWLADYPRLLSQFPLHARNKPPGPLLAHLASIVVIGDPHRAALVAGLAMGLLAGVSVVATFLLLRFLATDDSAAFFGASFFALTPSLILFFPELDQALPIVTCALLGVWVHAFTTKRSSAGVGAGLVLAAACFVSYSLLTLGVFLALYPLVMLERGSGRRWRVVVRQGLVGATSCTAAYGVLYLATGFNPIAALAASVRNQAELAAVLKRPFPATLPFDLADFCLGTGWVSVPLVVLFLVRVAGNPKWKRVRRLVLLCLAQVGVVAASGLLRTETARVWLFMMPLVAVPIGLELARWGPRTRLAAWCALWLVTVMVTQNMWFVRE